MHQHTITDKYQKDIAVAFMKTVYAGFVVLCCLSCGTRQNIAHEGLCLAGNTEVRVDTVYVNLTESSGYGNFYMTDTVITFADAMSCRFYDIDLSGNIVQEYFRKGRGDNEIPSMLYAYPIIGDPLKRGVIIDSGNGITFYDLKKKEILGRYQIDFNWDNRSKHKYSAPQMYNLADFTDFGMTFYMGSDSRILFQANIINRMTSSPGRVEPGRYEDGAIFGILNPETMEVESVTGSFPAIYRKKPMPHLEFFQYSASGDTVYVTHGVDSLIYVYRYPDEFLYTIGYECEDIDRDYTVTREIDSGDNFRNDFRHVGINTGLMYFQEDSLLCRTYIRTTATGASGMQIYRGNDLVADFGVPDYFKLLGYSEGIFYGARFVPLEDDDSTSLVLYRVTLDSCPDDDVI